jgi:hypothetical protein
MCVNHPGKAAKYTCSICNALICETCAFAKTDGTWVCPECAATKRGAAAPKNLIRRPLVRPGVMCFKHPGVQAVRRCRVCKKPVCATCDFSFPGGVHVCPDCIENAQTRGLSSKRKRNLVISMAMGICSILGFIFALIFASTAKTSSDVEAVGAVMLIFVMIPSLIGTIVGVATLEKRLGNPWPLWLAVITNTSILGLMILLTIIGNFS